MSGNGSFNPKVDVFMPLYIGRYLQDTTHLDALKSGALLHLLMHIWIRGPLPNDPETLATIAKCTPDAWSICQASVMHYFKLGADGMLHQTWGERLKDEWVGKRLKAHEKAQKAANARWREHKAKKQREAEEQAKTGDAPSIPQAEPEQCPISVSQVQKQKQPPPTPSASRRGIAQAPPPGAAHAPSTAPAGRPRPGQKKQATAASKRESKAKPGVLASTASRAARNGAMHHAGRRGGVAVGVGGAAGHPKKPPQPAKPDLRLGGFEREVLQFWRSLNPEHPKYTFSDPDRRALRQLLERHPEISIAELRRLLQNRAKSEINPAALPYKWLRSVVEYSAGPLRGYGKPAAAGRTF